jgi:hypothetical protein
MTALTIRLPNSLEQTISQAEAVVSAATAKKQVVMQRYL